MNNMLTLEEVKNFLEINDPDLTQYLKQGKLTAYKIGGTYLRFRKEDVLNLRFELLPKKTKTNSPASILARVGDSWRFNNFYILSLILVALLAFFVTRN